MNKISPARLRRALALATTALLGVAWLVAVPVTHAAAATTITVNGTSAGRTFGGIGAISGGGGNSRLHPVRPVDLQRRLQPAVVGALTGPPRLGLS